MTRRLRTPLNNPFPFSSSTPLPQDFPSCVVREEAVSSYRGLWPAAAALPHSCAPSTHEYVIKDVLFVRASGPLGPGQQLTRNYLGMQVGRGGRVAAVGEGWRIFRGLVRSGQVRRVEAFRAGGGSRYSGRVGRGL